MEVQSVRAVEPDEGWSQRVGGGVTELWDTLERQSRTEAE